MVRLEELNKKVDEIQVQLYIAMAAGFFAIVVLLILIIILCGLVERAKRRTHHETRNDRSRNDRPVRHQSSSRSESMPREEIVPGEDLARRGYRRHPNFSSGLVSRVESREDPNSRSISRQSFTRQQSIP